ncbi:hypothetical protein QQ045_031838 [Rhodiola kirilowii]
MKVRASSPTYSSLGVRRSGPSKHKPKLFLRRLVNYLKSDSYMFAPIISTSKRKYVLSPRKGFHVNAAGLEIGGAGDGKEKKKPLVDMIGEYMRSDSYMYAPLIEREFSGVARKEVVDPSSEGPLCLTKRVTTSTARTVLTRETNFQPTKESRGVIEEGQTEPFFIANHESDNASDRLPKLGETLKQVVFPNCWSSLLPGGDFAGNSSIAERVVYRRKIPVE